jgi:hypothetical protein
MKGFYDTMVPKDVAKYVKQWGAQVEKVDIKAPETAGQNARLRYEVYDPSGRFRMRSQRLQAARIAAARDAGAGYTVKSPEAHQGRSHLARQHHPADARGHQEGWAGVVRWRRCGGRCRGSARVVTPARLRARVAIGHSKSGHFQSSALPTELPSRISLFSV